MARRLVNHRVFGYPHNQSKFTANYTYHVDTSRHFVYFEVNYVRVTPRLRSSFQISDCLVWQLRDCVRVFFHVECMGIKCKVEKLLARANKPTSFLGSTPISRWRLREDAGTHRYDTHVDWSEDIDILTLVVIGQNCLPCEMTYLCSCICHFLCNLKRNYRRLNISRVVSAIHGN